MTGFRNALLGAAGAAGGGGYSVSNSIVLDDGSSHYLTGPTLSGGSERIGTYSFWTKRANLGTQQEIYTQYRTSSNNLAFRVRFLSGDTLDIVCENDAGGVILRRTTTQVFRDPHAFLHVHIQINGNKTDDTCCTLTINGSAVSDFSTKTNLSSGTDLNLFTSSKSAFIGSTPGPAGYYDGYFSEFVCIDGSALDATSFGEYDLNGVWRPINVSGLTFGTNGFYLDFAASGDLGNDVSGNANDFTTSGSPTQSSDTPTNVYPVMSPLSAYSNGLVDLSNGNLSVANSDANYDSVGSSILIPDSGKWGWQFTLTSSVTGLEIGFHDPAAGETGGLAQGGSVCLDGVRVDLAGGEIFKKVNSSTWSSSQTGLGAGANTDVFEFLWDATNGTLDIKKGGSAYGSQVTGLNSKPMRIVLDTQQTSLDFDFGQNGYAPSDSNYKTINSANLYTNAAPAIEDGTAHFQATTYTGTGSAREVNQSGNTTFQPDWVWVKERGGANEHRLIDAVRGATETLYLGGAMGTAGEATESTGVTSFDSDGFSVGTGGGYNNLNDTYVGWQWKGDGTSGSSNTDGSITTTVNANDTAGFSIVKWMGTGANGTCGHGLSAAPDLIMGRNYEDSGNRWSVYHSKNTSAPETEYLVLNTTAATTDDNTVWNDTAPTSTVFSVGTTGHINQVSRPSFVYCFRAIPGYSAFGSYVGNGISDGPLIILDFTPAYLLVKNINSGSVSDHWYIQSLGLYDYNGDTGHLFADATDVEQASRYFDYVSNGFKVVTTSATANGSNETHIYAAFAENPFAGSSPATAR